MCQDSGMNTGYFGAKLLPYCTEGKQLGSSFQPRLNSKARLGRFLNMDTHSQAKGNMDTHSQAKGNMECSPTS